MNNNILLRALENLFSNDTLLGVIYVLAFLFVQNAIKQFVAKKGVSKGWDTLLSAWISIILLLVSYLIFSTVALAINEQRFGVNHYNHPSKPAYGIWTGILLISSASAITFFIYHFVYERFISTIRRFSTKIIVDGLWVFLLANISMLCLQITWWAKQTMALQP